MPSYRDYLKSAQWREIRGVILGRANGLCEFCSAEATQVHHLSYPKRFGTEHPDSLVALCRACHEKMHGLVAMHEITRFKSTKVRTFYGDSMGVIVEEDSHWVYSSGDEWSGSLRAQFVAAKSAPGQWLRSIGAAS